MSSTRREPVKTPPSVEGYFAALRANDPAAWAACFAPDAVGEDPAGAPALRGRAAFQQMLTDFLPTWGRFDGIREDEVFAAGPATAVRWTGSGQSLSGREISWSGMNLYLLDDGGLIERFWAVFDADDLQRQLSGEATNTTDETTRADDDDQQH
ncbi:nuclear transport factor 2 family protein [Streptomyces sp. NP160]|uniref:nuclear transport factor 2 family protein n=1 Tax=Streptomyces sp. NP160 TaxID=2586637 RepID=UPI001117CB0D|nr:nuclear transport factor 2 family protein [Streptomyces sp. NP160]TNM63167.1 nuclear transport factor 2 family protein [Streptomyces sp. NP160]